LEDKTKIQEYVLGKQVVRTEGEWIWCKIVSDDEFRV